MNVERFKNVISVLKIVVGRSDEVFRKIVIDRGIVKAEDGCLRAFFKTEDLKIDKIAIPLETIWAFLRHSSGKMDIGFVEDSLVISSKDSKLVLKNPLRIGVDEIVDFEDLFEVSDLRIGLDYVSKPLDEDDFVEFHSGRDGTFSFARSYGISSAYVFEGDSKLNISVSIPYQSLRRLVKALQEIEGKTLIGFDGDLVIRIDGWTFRMCSEIVGGKNPPRRFDGVRIERRKILDVVELGADLKAFGTLTISGRSLRSEGRGKGVEFSRIVELESDLGIEAEVEVNFRKIRSYLSGMNSRYVYLKLEKGFLEISDTRFKRFIFLKERRT